MGNSSDQFTEIIAAVNAGDETAAEKLLPLVYDELRRLAAARMAHEGPGQTLQPTALVHEAWLRLVGSGNQHWNGRGHFFGAAAEAMRRILIDRARKRHRKRHGYSLVRIDFNELDVAITTDDDLLLRVNEALERLAPIPPWRVVLAIRLPIPPRSEAARRITPVAITPRWPVVSRTGPAVTIRQWRAAMQTPPGDMPALQPASMPRRLTITRSFGEMVHKTLSRAPMPITRSTCSPRAVCFSTTAPMAFMLTGLGIMTAP